VVQSWARNTPESGPNETFVLRRVARIYLNGIDRKGMDIMGISQVGKSAEREFFIDNLLARIYFIIEMIIVDRPCAMGVSIPSSR